jgi:hypothetical protein
MGAGTGGMTVVQSAEIVDTTRWAYVKRLVFGCEGRYYAMTWREGATETQDEDFRPQVVEVFPVDRVVTFYEEAPA